jgi:twitching motility two-component system response regulator PilG
MTFSAMNVGDNFEQILAQGIAAAQAGNRPQARILLQYAVELDQSSEAGWLWLASISEYPEELLSFLDHVLKINPRNTRASEWKTATNQLMAKTFVQRGIDASKEGRNDYATECFDRALSFDEQNQLAWFWKDSLSKEETIEVETTAAAEEVEAKDAKEAVDRSTHMILVEAEAFLGEGDRSQALASVEEAISADPDSEKAWSMRSHLVDDFEEKRRALARVVEINPENKTAVAALETLLAMVETVVPNIEDHAEERREPAAERFLNTPFDEVAKPMFSEHENSPTQELELPQAILDHNPFVENASPLVSDEVWTPETDADMQPDQGIHDTEAPASPFYPTIEVDFDDASDDYASADVPETISMPVQQFENFQSNEAQTSWTESYATQVEPEVREVSASAYMEVSADTEEFTDASEPVLTGSSWNDEPDNYINEPDQTGTWVINDSMPLPENEPDTDPGKTILVVDDSPVVRNLIAGKLQESGYNVLSAANGAEALAVISNATPDLVLLDIAMPKMDGYQVCENIRKNGATKDIPVVLISGKDGYYDENRAQMAGTSSYISKPFGPETLMKALETYLPSA